MPAMAEVQQNPPNIIQLLNQPEYNAGDFAQLVNILQNNPDSASMEGRHWRSTIWVCCQHSECRWRQAAVPLLVQYGANVNRQADNGKSQLLSLFNAWTAAKEHKRIMALILVYVCQAEIPEFDNRGNGINIRGWLAGAIR